MSEFINTADVIGDDEMCDQIITRTVTEYKENRVSNIGQYAFYGCSALTEVDVPNATSIADRAFSGCTALTEVNLPDISNISGSSQFSNCTNLIRADFPKLVIPNHDTATYMFDGCSNLEYVNLPNAQALGSNFFKNCTSLKWLDFHTKLDIVPCFAGCNSLTAIVLRSSEICPLYSAPSGKTDYGVPISSGTGYFYVPSTLYDAYISATNWNTIPDQIRKLEDCTVDGTVTGSLFWCTGVSLDKTKLTFDESRTETLVATLLTPSPYGFDVVEWKSADTSIATVSNGGVVTPKGKGTTTITASCNGYSASCEVVVTADV